MKRKIKKIAACVLASLVLIESAFIHLETEVYSVENGIAKRKEAIKWLEDNQNSDGSWGKEIKLRSTSEVLKFADKDWFTDTEVLGAASEWINSQKASNYDDIYRINSRKETEQSIDITEVTELQNSDGGWSLSENYGSDAFDTLLALEACVNAEEVHTDIIKKGVAYLLSDQMDNGAFSYADEKENVYLTAYASYVLKAYIRGLGRNDDSAKIALAEAEAYLMACEDVTVLWGLDENSMLATLMSSIVLAEKDIERTYNRIELIAEMIYEDGSVYGSPMLTAMFVSLVDVVTETEEAEAELTDLYVYTRDGEEIKAYTEVYIEPEAEGFDEESMTLSVVAGTREAGYEAIEFKGTDFVWNTVYNKPGKYEIYGIVTDNSTGDVLSIKKKVIDIKESYEIVNTYFNVTPAMYKIGSEKEIKMNLSLDIEANITKNIEALVTVADKNGNELYSDRKSAYGGGDTVFVEFNNYSFTPEVEESGTLYVQAEIFADGKKCTTVDQTINMYLESEGKRIDVSYELDKEYILPEEDEVNVKFFLEGVGLSEDEERKPIDIFVCLDNSWSMSHQDWKQAKLAAEQIVGYLSSDDRCTIQYIGDNKVKCELTSDKEVLISAINSGGINIFGGTKVDRSINLAIEALKDTPASRDKVYLLLSDGEPNNIESAITSAENAVTENIKIYTLGLGNGGAEFMQEIADMGSGKYVYSPTNEELVDLMVDMAGDIFSIAGTNAELSMTLEGDGDYDKTGIVPSPDNIIENEDGTTKVTWSKAYISLGELLDYSIQFNTSETEEGSIVNLIKDIQLTYTDVSDEEVTISINPIQVRVKNRYVSGTITTEKDNYIIGEDVTLTLEAIKESKDKEVTGVIEITDENGVTVEVLDNAVVIEDRLTGSFSWNTGEVVPGNYRAVISWYRNGKVTDTQECSFTVTEEVSETSEVETKDSSEDDMEADFVKIKGEISLSEKDVLTGARIDVAYDAINLGTKLLEDTELTVNVISVETQEAKVLNEDTFDIDIKATVGGEAGIDTLSLAEGQYLVTLNAGYDDKQLLLGATGFTVTETQYSIDITAGEGGNVNMEATGMYKENSSIELAAIPEKGYVFAGWMSENGGTFENEYSETTTFITPGKDTVVTALFVKQRYLVTVEAGNGGRIVNEVSGSYESGTEIELSAKAFSGYDFKCWTVSGEGTVKEEKSVSTIFMTGAGEAVVTAVFVSKGSPETPSDNTIISGVGENKDGSQSENPTTKENDMEESKPHNSYGEDKTVGEQATDSNRDGEGNSPFDVVKTGDFGERTIIVRNITFMLLIIVLVSLVVVNKEGEEQ